MNRFLSIQFYNVLGVKCRYVWSWFKLSSERKVASMSPRNLILNPNPSDGNRTRVPWFTSRESLFLYVIWVILLYLWDSFLWKGIYTLFPVSDQFLFLSLYLLLYLFFILFSCSICHVFESTITSLT